MMGEAKYDGRKWVRSDDPAPFVLADEIGSWNDGLALSKQQLLELKAYNYAILSGDPNIEPPQWYEPGINYVAVIIDQLLMLMDR